MRKVRRAHLNGARWEVDLGMIAGKRVRRFFRTREEAEIFLGEKKDALARHGQSAVALSEPDRVLFQAARDRLAAAGATIGQAVDFYLQQHRALREPVTLRRLLELGVSEKELGGMRRRSVQQFLCSCRSFIRDRAEQPAHTVTRDEVKGWILGNGFAPKTQRVYLGDLRSLFAWAVDERYMRKNPIAGEDGWIQLAKREDAEIVALDVEHVRALLRAALFGQYRTFDRARKEFRDELAFRELLAYLAIGLFAGVRPDEIKRSSVADLDLRERTLVVRGRSAKTRQRRVIELERTAVVWLRLWRKLNPGAGRFVPLNFERKWDALRKAAKLGNWPHDAMRHTFASYHYAAKQNLALLQAQMGHSEDEDTLFRHYRAVRTLAGRTVSRRMGEEFWGLTPRRIRTA
jgi:integrase